MKIEVTNQLSDCATKLAEYLVSENGLNVALKLRGSVPLERLEHKVLLNVYKNKEKLAFNKVLVVMTSDGIKKWNQQFYDIQDEDVFFTDEEEARKYCMELNKEFKPFKLQAGKKCDTASVVTLQYDKYGHPMKIYVESFSTYGEADIYYEKYLKCVKARTEGSPCDDKCFIKAYSYTACDTTVVFGLCTSSMNHKTNL